MYIIQVMCTNQPLTRLLHACLLSCDSLFSGSATDTKNEKKTETNQLRMSAERAGSLLREAMQPVPARLAATGPIVTAEQAGHYCIPIKLKRLYRSGLLGNPFAREDEEAAKRWGLGKQGGA